MNEPVNLWECLTHRADCKKGERDNTTLRALSVAARWSGQELSLEATEEGWVLRIFSCYEHDEEIVVTIPKDRRLSPRWVETRSST